MTSCPPYQDAATLAGNLCVTPDTIDNWVRDGILPPPKVNRSGKKRLWKWCEVERWLDGEAGETAPIQKLEELRDAARRATQ